MSTVIPHLHTLASLAISKYINTGDRMIDTACIAIVGVFVTWVLTNARIILKRVYQYVHIRTCTNEVFDPCTVDPFEYDEAALRNYKFSFRATDEHTNFKLSPATVDDWVFKTYNNMSNRTTCEMYMTKDLKLAANYDTDGVALNMPIHRYIANDAYEYIVYSNHTLYCNHVEELRAFTLLLANKVAEIEPDTTKRIYEVGKSGELTCCGKVNARKTFDRIHFDSKPEVMNLLEKFATDTMYPAKSCMNNKFGALLYGPPGTGKTGFCTAAANYLGRDILLLSSLVTAPRDKVLAIIEKCRKTHVIILDEFDLILARAAEAADYTRQILAATTKEEIDRLKKLAATASSAVGTEEFLLNSWMDSAMIRIDACLRPRTTRRTLTRNSCVPAGSTW